MNLNPIAYLKGLGTKATDRRGAVLTAQRESESLGPFQAALGTYIPRTVNPWLYEAIREAIGLIDGAIGTLVTMDGLVRVEGANQTLVDEITAWMQAVLVDDKQRGLQAFYAGQGNEQYEQGFAVGEWIPSADGRDIERLRVADSKGVVFVRGDDGTLQTWYRAPGKLSGLRGDGTDTMESLLRRTFNLQPATLLDRGFVQVDTVREVYTVNEPEAGNPYGTSKLRSLEFVSQVLVKIQNASSRAWERYGDPPLHLSYKTKNAKLTETQLATRQALLQQELTNALTSKAKGNSTDLVTATGALDEIAINVIGALGLALDPATPTAMLVDQILTKFGLPAWLLGLESAGAAAERQSEMVLQSSRTRFELRKPGLTHLVATMLRMRGRTWKAGDWELKQELPSLQDMMKIAQANFLNAQAAMVGQGNNTPAPQGIDNNLRNARRVDVNKHRESSRNFPIVSGCKVGSERWAEDEEELTQIERAGIRKQVGLWRLLRDRVIAELVESAAHQSVDAAPAAGIQLGWVFDQSEATKLIAMGNAFFAQSVEEDAPVLRAMFEAWARGQANAAADIGIDPVAELNDLVKQSLRQRGLASVSNTKVRAFDKEIVAELTSGVYDGLNPQIVAASLKRKFDVGEYNWERLVRSEMAIAQSMAKTAVYQANDIEQYDWLYGGGACAVCRGIGDMGPYKVGLGPIPVVDTHPECLCSITPHVD